MWNEMTNEEKKERIRRRVRAKVDAQHYSFFPETIQTDTFRIDEHQRAAVYARVSTDDSSQTSSFELQRIYYKEFIEKHAQWELVKIYADEGISGTSLRHRDAFNEMMLSLIRAGAPFQKRTISLPPPPRTKTGNSKQNRK